MSDASVIAETLFHETGGLDPAVADRLLTNGHR